MSKLLVVTSVAALLAAIASPDAIAVDPGRSGLRVCMDGGWQDLTTSEGAAFANQVECVVYAARGGALQERVIPEECQAGAYADLFPQDGSGTLESPASTFQTEGSCADWLSAGNSYGVLKPELRSRDAAFQFWLTVDGYAGQCGIRYAVTSSEFPPGSGFFGCLDPPVQGTSFQIFSAGCTPGAQLTATVTMTTASGGVVSRTVASLCA